MKNTLVAVLLFCIALALAACNRSSPPPDAGGSAAQPGAASANSGTPDSMTAELTKLAGSGATDCGRVAPNDDVNAASQCAMQANQANKPFFVRYDLPMPDAQMSVATVRTSDGKLMSVQYDSKGWEKAQDGFKLSDDKKVSVGPCPADGALRVAGSGRVTCFPPAQMPGGMSPHGGMGMPSTGTAPHGGMGMPPAGTPNPHAGEKSPTKAH